MKIIIFLVFISSTIMGQINISRLSFDFSYLKNYQMVSNYEYSYSPEVKVGGMFFSEILEWEIYTSYWDDGIDKELKGVMDHITFSYSNLGLGGKIYFIPSKFKFHLLANAGLSFRHVTQRYIGGSLTGIPYDDKSYKIISLDLGVGFRYLLIPKLRIRTEVNAYIALSGNVNHFNEYSYGALKMGIDYIIK